MRRCEGSHSGWDLGSYKGHERAHVLSLLSSRWEYNKNLAVYNPGEGSHQNQSWWHPGLEPPELVGKKMVITLSVYGTLLEQLKLRQSPQQVSQKHHVTHISYKEHQWPSDRQSSYLSLVLIQLPNFFLCHLKSWSFLCETCLLSVATLSWSSYLHVVVTSSSVLYAFLQAHSLKGLTSVSPHCSPRTIFLCRGLGCVLQKDAEILTLSVCECDLIWK